MQRPQLTTRRLLALVAALALIFGLVAGLRRERFRSQSAEYASTPSPRSPSSPAGRAMRPPKAGRPTPSVIAAGTADRG